MPPDIIVDVRQVATTVFGILFATGLAALIWKAAGFMTAMSIAMTHFGEKLTENSDDLMKMMKRHDDQLEDHEERLVEGERWRSNSDAIRADRARRGKTP